MSLDHDTLKRRRNPKLAQVIGVAAILVTLFIVLVFANIQSRRDVEAARTLAAQEVNAANTAEAQVATIEHNANIAQTAAVDEQIQAASAIAAQETSEYNVDLAATQVAEARSMLWANSARQALDNDDTLLALQLALAANRFDNSPGLAQAVLFDAANHPGAIRRFGWGTGLWSNVVFNPAPLEIDGTVYDPGQIAIVCSHGINLWDLSTGEKLRTLDGHTEAVENLAINPAPLEVDGTLYGRGQTALSGSWDSTLILWDLSTGEALRTFQASGDVLSVAINPAALEIDGTVYERGRTALSGSGHPESTLILWDLSTGEELRIFRGYPVWVRSVAFSLDGQTALSNAGSILILLDLSTGEILRTFRGHTDGITGLAVNPAPLGVDGTLYERGQTVLSSSYDNTLILWDLNTGEALHTFDAHTGEVVSLAISPDGQTALSASEDKTLILWDLSTGEALYTLYGHTSEVEGVGISPDGNTALSGTSDHNLILWDISGSAALRTFQTHNGGLYSVAFSPDGQTALSGSSDSALTLWDLNTGEVLRTFHGHTDIVSSVVISPDGQTALSGSEDKTLILWDLNTGEALHTLHGHTGWVVSVAFSPDGQTALSGSRDKTLILWDLSTGEALRTIHNNTGAVESVTISPDGQTALSSSSNDIVLWNLSTGERLRTLQDHRSPVESVAINPASLEIDGTSYSPGQTALSASKDNTLILWDLNTGETLHTFHGHTDWVLNVAISPDGQTALSGSADNTLILWDLSTGEALRTFRGHTGSVLSVAFSSDGRTAFSGSEDNTLIMWEIKTLSELIDWVYTNRYMRDLTCQERIEYQVDPYCDKEGHYPSRTPYPTLTPRLVVPSNTRSTQTPIATPTLSATETANP